MGVIKWGGKLRARGNVSVGGSAVLFGASEDAQIYRSAANILQLGSGDSMRFALGTGATNLDCNLFVPNSTAVGTGTATINENGKFLVGQRAAGSPCLITRLNGTTYYAALTAV